MNDLSQLRKIENLIKAGAICGGVSLIIGGVLLASAGLVCVIIGSIKIATIDSRQDTLPSDHLFLLNNLKRTRTIGLVVCVLALILNAYALWMMLPLINEVLNTGDISSLESLYSLNGASNSSGSPSVSTSTWG